MSDYDLPEPTAEERAEMARFQAFCADIEQREDALAKEIELATRLAMRAAGEDPSKPALLATRVAQVTYALNSKAQRRWEEALRS